MNNTLAAGRIIRCLLMRYDHPEGESTRALNY